MRVDPPMHLRITLNQIFKNCIFHTGVSGGSIIKYLAQVFEKSPSINWLKWAVFFCDERLVEFEADDSTYGQFKVNNFL